MIMIMKPGAPQSSVDAVVNAITAKGLQPHLSQGDQVTIVGFVGDKSKLHDSNVEISEGVDKIVMMGSDSNQLANNIMNTTTQLSEGMAASLGIDLKTLLAGVLGHTIGSKSGCDCGGNCHDK